MSSQKARAYQRQMFELTNISWETPQPLFDELDAEFGFTLDVCASVENAKCERFYTIEQDGLLQPWRGVCWMNPPYGREIPRWTAKAAREVAAGAVVVGLLPARTDTAWWHEDVLAHEAEVRFLRGRVRFNDAQPAPFPSVVVVWRPSPRATGIRADEASPRSEPRQTGSSPSGQPQLSLRAGSVGLHLPPQASPGTSGTPLPEGRGWSSVVSSLRYEHHLGAVWAVDVGVVRDGHDAVAPQVDDLHRLGLDDEAGEGVLAPLVRPLGDYLLSLVHSLSFLSLVTRSMTLSPWPVNRGMT